MAVLCTAIHLWGLLCAILTMGDPISSLPPVLLGKKKPQRGLPRSAQQPSLGIQLTVEKLNPEGHTARAAGGMPFWVLSLLMPHYLDLLSCDRSKP